MKTYSRYAEQYNKRKAPQLDKSKVISSENDTYQQFLEIQLEKVTNALLMTKDYEERFQHLERSNVNFEEKMAKFMNMAKLLQNFAEAQEKENCRIFDRIQESSQESHQNYSKIDNLNTKLEPKMKNFECDLIKLSEKVDSEVYDELKYLNKSLQEIKSMSSKKIIEDYMDKFRDEMNKKIELVMNETQKSALNSDLEQVQKILEDEKREREYIFEQINKEAAERDKISHELLDEILKKYKNLEENFENKGNIRNNPKNNDEGEHYGCSLKISKLEKELDDLKYSNHVINTKLSKNNIQGGATMKDLQALEKSMIQQFSKGLDQFGDMIKKYMHNQNTVSFRLDTVEKHLNLSNDKAKSEVLMKPKEEETKKHENPFLQNKENYSLYSNNKSIEKKPNFQEYLKNSREIKVTENRLDSSSDLEDLLINKENKNSKIKPKLIDKPKKKRSRSVSNLKKNEKAKPPIKENNSRSVKKQRKVSPDSRSILNRISMERKEKEHKIKELIKKEKKVKKSLKA